MGLPYPYALATLQHECEVKGVKFSPSGSLLPTTLGGSGVTLLTVSDWKCVRELRGHSDCVFDCARAPDGGSLASSSRDCHWRMWRPRRYAEEGAAEGGTTIRGDAESLSSSPNH